MLRPVARKHLPQALPWQRQVGSPERMWALLGVWTWVWPVVSCRLGTCLVSFLQRPAARLRRPSPHLSGRARCLNRTSHTSCIRGCRTGSPRRSKGRGLTSGSPGAVGSSCASFVVGMMRRRRGRPASALFAPVSLACLCILPQHYRRTWNLLLNMLEHSLARSIAARQRQVGGLLSSARPQQLAPGSAPGIFMELAR